MQKILITGAGGFIGSHTTDTLLAAGKQVIGIDNFSTGNRDNLSEAGKNPLFTLIEGDITEPGLMGKMVAEHQPDSIIHLAALVSVPAGEEDPGKNFHLNVIATQMVAEAARNSGVKRTVFASSAAVYGNSIALPLAESGSTVPISQYGAAKLMSEQLLQAYATSYGISSICFRFFNVYGPRQDPKSPYSGVVSIFAERYISGAGATVFGDGEQSRDFIFVKDLAKALSAAATDPTQTDGIYNLCTGKSSTLLDLIDILAEAYPEVPAAKFAEDRAGDIKHSLGKPDAARELLAFEASTPFSDGIRALLDSLA
ncbi:MAG: UDP-glucose 4-epimerase [Verrucomicrobiales bacterium]|jgi:UDP-glucose 4-epimerase